MAAPDYSRNDPRRAGLEFAVSCLLLTAVPIVVYLDTQVFGTSMSEQSLTEGLQSALLAISAAMVGYAAYKLRNMRGYLALLATLFTCMLIRESDAVFDRITHGFWIYPAVAALALGVIVAFRNADTIKPPFAAHIQHRSATLVYLGLFFVLVFSRLFGTGALWEGVMGENYDPAVKAAIQEGLELMGYVVIGCGSVMSAATWFASRVSDDRAG